MSWLLWRQNRTQTQVTAAILGVFTIAVVITGIRMAHDYHAALTACPAGSGCEFVGHLFNGDGAIIDAVHLSILLPVLLGVFLGAPLIAREVEQSTNVLVWTQSVPRRVWLRRKIAVALGGALVLASIVTVLVTWWSRTPNSLFGNRFEGAEFLTQGALPVVLALFGVALGLAAGALFRRTLPAIAVTVLVYVLLGIVVAVYVRPHYGPTTTRSVTFTEQSAAPSGSWTVSLGTVDASGHFITNKLVFPSTCPPSADREQDVACLSAAGFRNVVKYHPPSQYWRFQATESALYLVLAAGLVVFAYRRTLVRDA
jgi:disulfide bond formation protein DsbB